MYPLGIGFFIFSVCGMKSGVFLFPLDGLLTHHNVIHFLHPLQQGQDQHQSQPTSDAGSGIRTRATLWEANAMVLGEHSNHCAIYAVTTET